ncbi:MAG: glycosyltransferase family A protein [Gammaproteobacteria bacterium]|nr:glycosyltransferase family A protein [Gammaproteobacteria bacterium]
MTDTTVAVPAATPILPVAVVIPSHNRKHTLARALDSVLAQTRTPAEIVVVDDGSGDGTDTFITRNYPQIRLLCQANAGVSAARNHGIAATRAPWLAFLDSDDEWLPDKLAQQFACIKDHPDAAIVHCDEIWIRHGRRVNPGRKHQKQGGDIFEQCLALCAISPSAVLLRRSVLESTGGFDESLVACEDYDLWLQLTSQLPVHYIDQPLLRKFGGHNDQLSRQHWGMDRFRVKALAKLLRQTKLSPNQFLMTRRTLAKKCNVLMKGALRHNNREVMQQCQSLLSEFEISHDH